MTKTRSLALVCAGPISRTTFSRLPKLAARLGPVKSGSLQSASRTVNLLGGGRAVAAYQDLSASRTILVNVPDEQLSMVVAELAGSFGWKHKIAILCNSKLDSSSLAPLERLGASVGSFDAVPGWDGLRFVIEGSGPASREMRKLLQHGLSRPIRIDRGAKGRYLAGAALASSLLTPLIAASVKSFRSAGVPLKEARGIVARLAERSLKECLKKSVITPLAAPGVEWQALAASLELANARFADVAAVDAALKQLPLPSVLTQCER